jgi:hypothetical protein
LRLRARWVLAVLVAAGLLLVARILLPYYLEYRSDRILAELEGVTGTVGNIDLSIAGSRARIEQFLIENRDAPSDAERGHAVIPELRVDWSWWKALSGHLYCSAHLERPQLLVAEIEMVEPPEPPRADSGLLLSLPEIIPFTIERLTVADGTLRYQDMTSSPLIDLTLSEIDLLVRDVTNLPQGPAVELPSSLLMTAAAPGGGTLTLEAQFNPLADAVRADINAELVGVDMQAINDLLIVYADLDVHRGELHLFAEAVIADGHYDGYVKVLMREVDVFSWQADRADGIFQKFWEALAGGTAEILENQPANQQAMRIPISGDVTSAGTDLSQAITSALTNAFIRAMRPGVEGRLQYEDVDEVAATGEAQPP